MSTFLPTLTERRSPWVTFTRADDPWVARAEADLLARDGLVLRIAGGELDTEACVYRTFARDLGFIGYFGHNWDAMVDCLGDWHGPGHGKRDVAVIIDAADDLLGADFLGVFVSTLARGAWRANFMVDGDGDPDEWRDPFALHFVLLLDRAEPAAFARKVVSRDTDLREAVVDGRLLVTLTDVDRPGGDPVWPPVDGPRAPVARRPA
ncbi:barstar family protein [Streptomyces sp. NPDC048331]|uniref:barstar family protein n=1 Tax=Streptomyces sp. NPDC048331 TaxID=3365534 RepID=UPI003715F4F5